MARYSRRIGPPAPQALTTTLSIINGTTMTRFWDSGTILILWFATLQDQADPAADLLVRPHLDGASLGISTRLQAGTPNTFRDVTGWILTDITEGVHTFDLRANTNDAVQDSQFPILGSLLSVIQFPDWEPTLEGL